MVPNLWNWIIFKWKRLSARMVVPGNITSTEHNAINTVEPDVERNTCVCL